MSKINAIRFINLSYNYNGIRVDDETFHLGGESTMLSLRNGGGKSVLVQMMIAPFVHKRYRDSKDRPFWSYFTTNKPTFILIEWKLDGNSGYVLTGMMVRKSQDIRDNQSQNELDIYQFIHEYKERNDYDIHNIPFINNLKDNKKLKTYSSCKEILENLKMDKNYKFSLFDMNNSTSSRNYYNKLEEYQIYRKEWESIVKKVNIKESGLSDLFLNAKDETGLMESWFLPAVEEKLNKGKNRIDEFRIILASFIKQYKDNKSKIEQKETILLFKEETKAVLQAAEDFKSSIDDQSILENTIANLIATMTKIKNLTESHKISLLEKEENLNEMIRHIQYQELSFHIYGLQNKKSNFEDELCKVEKIIANCEEKSTKLKRQRDIQHCSKIYNLYKDASLEVQELENKLELKKDEDKDRSPEIESLGYTLKVYYDKEKYTLESLIKALEKEIQLNKDKKIDLSFKLEKLENEEKVKIRHISAIETKIMDYSQAEKDFNNLYNENLTRNILSEYEEQSLDLRIINTKAIVEKMGIDLVRLKNTAQNNKQELHKYKKQIEEKGINSATISEEIKGIEKSISDYKREIEERKIIIRYIGYPEEKLFNTEEILNLFQKSMEEKQTNIKSNEREVEKLEEEYNKLKSGKILELPKDFEEALDAQGLHYIYGMDWLKKNNNTADKNRELVQNNPFIPYGLIMPEKDIETLKFKNLGIYTSFPIPIINRDILDMDFKDIESSIHIDDKVNFYLLFNDNLLDEEQLKTMLEIKEAEINSVKGFINTRREDYNQDDKRYNVIKHQTITERNYRDTQNRLANKEQLKRDYENQLKSIRSEEHDLTGIYDQNLSDIINMENEIRDLKRKLKDLIKLNEKYEEYLKQRLEKGILENILYELETEIDIIKQQIIGLEENDRKTHDSRRDQISNLKSMADKYEEYSIYDKVELDQRDIEDVEARYKAVTSEIVNELKDLEDSLKRARTRFKKQEDDLVNTSKRLKLVEEEYIDIVYDSFKLETIEQDIEQNQDELKTLNNNRANLNTQVAVTESEIIQGFINLKDILGKIELLPGEQIILKEFKRSIIEKRDQLRRIKESLNQVNAKLINYDSNISNLVEYSEFPLIAHIDFEVDISTLDRKGLDKFRGELLRDYRQIKDKQNDYSNKLSQNLDHINRNKAFKDDFFSKPLNRLYSLINNPVEFIEQLMITIRAYDDLMEKLEVDIAIIEQEKERVVEILLEYIRDIHRNMLKIDKNSTIKIKDKPIKMLRIILPEWDSEEYSYRIKLKAMVEGLTQSGVIRLENNENIDELIGPAITITNLYNTVVGIKNIDIKLYKIEAERQYSISWADVAKNSGGEGFLSAFVVLSSLLSFMRRDETDIFAESEEGKVLLMDNPFAQTNSSHLLRPLMDIAKKSNTQLICLTGLGGESIYNCFDNIYVLNTIASNLRKGTEYLISEHTKGEEFEEILSSQVKIEDMDQIGFLF